MKISNKHDHHHFGIEECERAREIKEEVFETIDQMYEGEDHFEEFDAYVDELDENEKDFAIFYLIVYLPVPSDDVDISKSSAIKSAHKIGRLLSANEVEHEGKDFNDIILDFLFHLFCNEGMAMGNLGHVHDILDRTKNSMTIHAFRETSWYGEEEGHELDEETENYYF